MFNTLLIANRGEIACRIVRTARRMGIATVAVYSDADAEALHVRTADRAVRIGPAPARESYLNADAVIEAARRTGAQAIHPGYGFLSENAEFAEACEKAGLIFVGPPAEAMRAMGSKAAAKALMERSGVPLLPGYHGDDQNPDHLAAQAARIGFPLVIKAVAGGGGRGMRVVRAAGDFATALASARQEAASSFGDDRVLIERYLDRPRHIEVQVFADMDGDAVHLFERDCSAQRRHQKVIEEAPAPGLDPVTRAAMGEAAVAAAKAVGYVGAGTVEFVSDGEGFFFLEMNTRLQVEHPVTEAVTGLDLVEWQLRVAAGEPLPATGNGIRLHGHAMEARLYAEDSRTFAPSTGRLAAFHMPAEARVDTGFAAGDTVPVHYDAMLAKLIVHGATREEARRKLLRALADCEVAGVATNIELLTAIAAHPVFAAGAPDTGFIEREMASLMPHRDAPPEALAVAALCLLLEEREGVAHPASPWDARDGWWLNAAPVRVLEIGEGEAVHRIGVRGTADGWTLKAGGRAMAARAERAEDGAVAFVLDGIRARARATRLGTALTLRLAGETWRFRLPEDAAVHAEEDTEGGRLVAPIPGQVTQVLAEAGQPVTKGETLVVLEAMKTVFRLNAPADAVVAHVSCRVGETVEEGQVLIAFGDEAGAG
jgi:3-methylcrotonyl-CoA carboxylase alpha subunit